MNFETFYNAEEKFWYGPETARISDPDISVGHLALKSLLENPTGIAQIYEPADLENTNEEIAVLTVRVAKFIQKQGLNHEDVIGICAANTKYVAPLVLGALLVGVPINTLDPTFDRAGIKHIYGITKPKLMFCDGKLYEVVKSVLEELGLDCPIFTMKDHIEGVRTIDELLVDDGEDVRDYIPPKLALGGDQTAAILCSSGSTGLPKGVTVPHKALNDDFKSLNAPYRVMSFATVFWISGLITVVMSAIAGFTRVITDKSFSPELLLDIVEKHKLNIIIAPPSQMAMTVKCPRTKSADFSSVRLYICGGSAVPHAIFKSMQTYIKHGKVLANYMMTETGRAVTTGDQVKPGCNGKVSRNMKVKIVSDEGERLGPEETGEICIKLPHKWSGYYKNPEATAATIDSEGWIKSGDLGYFSEDGDLFIVDRKKEIYKYSNFHWSPSEIEQVISEIPDVIEVNVVGIPDQVVTDLPAAAIIKKPCSDLTEQYVSDYVAEKMVHFKQLRGGVYFFDTLPKTASGKNVRREVQKMVEKLHGERDNDFVEK